jgi:hypothetical protein
LSFLLDIRPATVCSISVIATAHHRKLFVFDSFGCKSIPTARTVRPAVVAAAANGEKSKLN